MNKKHIRQMTGSLLRRTAAQPAAKYLAPHRALLRRWLEEENFLQRFAPLFDGTRLSCAAVLSLCREELERLSPCPEEGWLAYAYGFARGGLFPEQFPQLTAEQTEQLRDAVDAIDRAIEDVNDILWNCPEQNIKPPGMTLGGWKERLL